MNGRIARELRREARVSCDPRQGLCYEDVDKKLRGMGGKVLKDKKGNFGYLKSGGRLLGISKDRLFSIYSAMSWS